MLGFDPKGDFEKVIDGSENVTLEVSGTANRVVLNAHRNQISTEEVEASNGLAKLGDTIWQWPTSETPTQPALGSVIVDGDGNNWTILSIDKRVMNTVWSAICRNLAVEARLDTLVTIQTATYAKDADGVAVPTWSDAYTSVRAKVQPITQTPEVEHDADETEQTVRIILESDLAFVPAAQTIGS
jgi:hypothetical protein